MHRASFENNSLGQYFEDSSGVSWSFPIWNLFACMQICTCKMQPLQYGCSETSSRDGHLPDHISTVSSGLGSCEHFRTAWPTSKVNESVVTFVNSIIIMTNVTFFLLSVSMEGTSRVCNSSQVFTGSFWMDLNRPYAISHAFPAFRDARNQLYPVAWFDYAEQIWSRNQGSPHTVYQKSVSGLHPDIDLHHTMADSEQSVEFLLFCKFVKTLWSALNHDFSKPFTRRSSLRSTGDVLLAVKHQRKFLEVS